MKPAYIITLILLIYKLITPMSISWTFVFCPIWIPLLLSFILILGFALFVLISLLYRIFIEKYI